MTTLAALDYETVPWTPSVDGGRSRRSRAAGSYQAAVPADIADLHLDLPPALHADAEDATAQIARFDAELGSHISAYSAVLLRSESAASSRIEKLTASARSIAEAELPSATGKFNAERIVANTAAMTAAIAVAHHVDTDAVLRMHAELMRADPAHPGRWRTEQVWIGGGNSPHTATFVPPTHDRVPAAIEDLITFAARADVPALAQIAVAHAQFETIHPFTDGNGRTGRALAQAMFRTAGVTRHVTIPVSAGLLADTDGYFAALTAFRGGDPVPIVEGFTRAAIRAVVNSRQLVDDLHQIRRSWGDRLTARSDSATWKVADLLLRRPVVNGVLIRNELGIATDHPQRHVGPLANAGIVVEFTDKSRNRAWRAPEVLAALDAFAERAGRCG